VHCDPLRKFWGALPTTPIIEVSTYWELPEDPWESHGSHGEKLMGIEMGIGIQSTGMRGSEISF